MTPPSGVPRRAERGTLHGVKVLYVDAENVFAQQGRVLVQVRRGAMSHAALDAVEALIPAITAGSEPLGLLVVFEPSAVVPSADVRRRQQEIVRRSIASPHVHAAITILEAGVTGVLLRTVSRTMALGNPRTRTFSTLEDAATWVAEVTGSTRDAVVGLAARARALS